MPKNNALSAKAKAMYGRRLSAYDYEELLKRRNVSEIAMYLKNQTEYANVLKDVKENTIHRGQLEILLNRDRFNRRTKLQRYVTGKNVELHQTLIEKEEIEQLLSCIRALISNDYGSFVSDLPLFMNPYMSFDLNKLLEVNSLKSLDSVLEKTIYHDVLSSHLLNENFDYALCEHELNVFYYERLIRIIKRNYKGKTRNELLTLFNHLIELKNITKIYRMKKYFNNSIDEIKKSLLPCENTIKDQIYEQMYDAKDVDTVLKLLSESPYKIKTDDDDFIYIEKYISEVEYRISKRYMNFALDPNVVCLAYYFIDDIEVENLINIIEGVRYNIVPSKIEKLLVY